MDSLSSLAEVLGLIVVLILILVATYYTTRFIAKQTSGQLTARNIKVIETYKISPTKYIQIVYVAGRYLAIAVSKDQVTMLTEVSEDDIVIPEHGDNVKVSFSEMMGRIKKSKG